MCKFVLATQSCESKLTFGPYIILSREGSQKGDALSRHEFCDTVHPILAESPSKMKLGYMDDFKLGGRKEAVSSDVQRIIDAEKTFGLRLNATKCEIVAKNFDVIKNYQIFKNFNRVLPEKTLQLWVFLSLKDLQLTRCHARKLKTLKG